MNVLHKETGRKPKVAQQQSCATGRSSAGERHPTDGHSGPDPRPLLYSLTAAHSLQLLVTVLLSVGEVMQSLQRIVHLSRDVCC